MIQKKHNRIESIEYWENDRLVQTTICITEEQYAFLKQQDDITISSQVRTILKKGLQDTIPKRFTAPLRTLSIWVPQQTKDRLFTYIHDARRGQFIRWLLEQHLNNYP